MNLFLGRRRQWSLFVAALSLAVFAASTQAEGWSLWKKTETRSDDGVGGMPYANSSKENRSSRSSGYAHPSTPADSSSGWNVGAGMSNAGKSVVNGATTAMSKTASITKKAAKKTVDIVTLKPLWAAKPAPNPFQLGSHPDPRSHKNSKPALWGASSKTKSEPRTTGQFFSQQPVR
ncbi:MAG: hypothetical protein K8U03_25200 [Planctomycetia bacterium]|nr:hypothetical protein [Planctomycetia bacterium]